uniref:Uncharacterized protein n=1 Tax=Anguilla anguilla TaxID=7936 RepID=A0A0E9V095_ANGAN
MTLRGAFFFLSFFFKTNTKKSCVP